MSIPNTQWQSNPLLRTPAAAGFSASSPLPSSTLTPRELNQPAGMSTIDGGFATGYNPAFGGTATPTTTPGAAPVVAPASAPNPAAELERIRQEALRIQGMIPGATPAPGTVGASFAMPGLETTPSFQDIYGTEPNADDVRRQQLAMFQSQIDATNQVYDQLLGEARLQGQGRLGSQRAMSARGGLLGSDFGASQKANVEAQNLNIERGIGAERQAAIGAIMGEVNRSVQEEMRAKREARQQGAENYLQYLSMSGERKAANTQKVIASMLAQGYDPTTADDAEINAMLKGSNLTANDIRNSFLQAKQSQEVEAEENLLKRTKTEAEINKLNMEIEKGQWQTIGEGTMLINRATGEQIKNPKTYAPGTGSGSELNLTPDNKRVLLGGGWSESEISSIHNDVKQNGLPAVIEQARKSGASDTQIRSLERAYKVEGEETNSFLSADYFKSLFGEDALKKTAGADWNPFTKNVGVDSYLESLMNTVELYRTAGYTDQQILKMMQ